MILLQAEKVATDTLNVAAQAAETTKALLSGDTSRLDKLLDQCISFCAEGGKSILVALIIYLIGRFLVKGLNALLAKMLERKKVDPTIQSFLKSFVNILLTILLIISVISALGVNTTSFAALLASVGLAFGMAMSGNLQNLAGGLIILLFKPYKVGDYIEAQGTAGTVKEIQIFHTIVTTIDNKVVFLPNGSLSSGNITNYSNSERRVDLTIGVEYGEDTEKVKSTLMELIQTNDKILKDEGHEPFVGLSSLSNSSVDFVVRMWVKGADYWPVFFGMQETIYKEFNKRGIGFPFPQLTVHQAKD